MHLEDFDESYDLVAKKGVDAEVKDGQHGFELGKYGLNNMQLEAVTFFGEPLLIIAGAGTGKTKTITSKVSYVIENGLAYPNNILAVTFTNKAANEMKERIEKIIGSQAYGIWVGTFHGICLKILRRNHEYVGLKQEFSIVDAQDQKQIISGILDELSIDAKTFPVKSILGVISRAKNKRVMPYEMVNSIGLVPGEMSGVDLPKIYEMYNRHLKTINSVDFDDIILKCLELLEGNGEVLKYYQNMFKYILVDEYQDINTIQYQWIKKLIGANKNVCCVGDDDQSIYGWRGADVGNIISFQRDFPTAHTIRLEQNYRSSPAILAVADAVIKNNSARLGKKLWTNSSNAGKVDICCYEDGKNETFEIVNKINGLTYATKNYKDVAILVRSTAQTRVFEEFLLSNALPYRIVGGLRFYERKEIKDIISYLKILVSDFDQISFKRAMLYPKRGISENLFDSVANVANKSEVSFFDNLKYISERAGADDKKKKVVIKGDLFGEHVVHEAADAVVDLKGDLSLKPRQRESLKSFYSQLKHWRGMLDFMSPKDIAVSIIKEIDYEAALEAEKDGMAAERIENINELLTALDSFESLSEFLEYASLVSDVDENDSGNEVSIMTIHASKGLEFPVVFLPACEEGIFPNQRAIDEGGQASIEEERRLAYVAITRAMSKLFISFAKYRFLYGSFQTKIKSRFVDEILEDASAFINLINFDGKTEEGHVNESIFKRGSSVKQKISKAYESREVYNLGKILANDSKIAKFANGVKVMHATFGIGVVRKVESLFADVEFEDGTQKTIRTDFLKSVQ